MDAEAAHRHTPLLCGALAVTDCRTHSQTHQQGEPLHQPQPPSFAPKDQKRESQATTRAHLSNIWRIGTSVLLLVSEASRHAVQFLRNPLPTTFMK
ncbi:hypothetical protein DTO271G3_6357 [Paecilomyces variotii]|nr:hypothetical protein DTO271G3_6357 [Paecilomyces variotii]